MSRHRAPPELVEWVHVLCLNWGFEVRRLWLGASGYSDRSSMVMLIEGRYLANVASALTQRWPEVLTPRARMVGRALLHGCDALEQDVVAAHYVIPGDAVDKAPVMQLSRSAYYRRLRRANRHLETELEAGYAGSACSLTHKSVQVALN